MNRLRGAILLLTTNLSWWLMKQKEALTVLTVSYFRRYYFLEWTHNYFQQRCKISESILLILFVPFRVFRGRL